MTWSPVLWGASLASALGGALAGNAVGSTPMLDRPTIGNFYQSHEDSAVGVEAVSQPLPDHYPLVTPEGVIPVAALSTRGLYSQARYRPYAYAGDYLPPEPGIGDYSADHFAEQSALEPHLATADHREEAEGRPTAQDSGTAASESAGFDSGPLTVARGRAKLIDVEATLALR